MNKSLSTLVVTVAIFATATTVHASTIVAKAHTYKVAGLFGDCMAHDAFEDYYTTPNTDCDYGMGTPTNMTKKDHMIVASPANETKITLDLPVESVVKDETIVDDNPVIPAESGNPGNLKNVGNAGENPNNKGTMPADSTDGNGEHGNQGVNH